VHPHQFGVLGPQGPIEPFGWVLMVAGLVGFGVTLLLWKRWEQHGDKAGFNHAVELSTYF
jgi:hypothetical protein